jgi:dienelactone hydrolase
VDFLHRKRETRLLRVPRRRGASFWPLIVLLSAVSPLSAQTGPGPQGAPEGPLHRQLWLIPSQQKQVLMRTMLVRPGGPGPFPLAIINHGSTESAELRARFVPPSYDTVTEWLVRRGYAVALPLRPGHGATGGPYLETNGNCEQADFRKSGLATADSIEAAIRFLTAQPFIRKAGVMVIGHSAGGWGALALAGRNVPAVSAVIVFAAGRGGRVNGRPNNNCAPGRLIEAARDFGAGARTPALSIEAENDTVIGADLAGRVASAYRGAGGKMDFRLLPAFGREGHALFEQGVDVWGPVVEGFLKNLR